MSTRPCISTPPRSAAADHPLIKLFYSLYGRRPQCYDDSLYSLGISSLELIAFLAQLESELRVPLEPLLRYAAQSLTFAVLLEMYEKTPGASSTRQELARGGDTWRARLGAHEAGPGFGLECLAKTKRA